MDNVKLGERLVAALALVDIDTSGIERLCQTLEAGHKALTNEERREDDPTYKLAMTPIDLEYFSNHTRSLLAAWRLTTLGALQMVSTTELSWKPRAFGRGRIRQMRNYLQEHDPELRFRKYNEPIANRAQAVYGDVPLMPASVFVALYVTDRAQAEQWLEVMEKRRWRKAKDFQRVTRLDLRQHLLALPSEGTSSAVDRLLQWLKEHNLLLI